MVQSKEILRVHNLFGAVAIKTDFIVFAWYLRVCICLSLCGDYYLLNTNVRALN